MLTTDSLLDQLVCLQCRHTVSRRDKHCECPGCGQCYALADGIPVMLPETSRIVHELPGEPSRGPLGALKKLGARLLNARVLTRMGLANAENMLFLRSQLSADATVLLAGGGIRQHGEKIDLLGPDLLANTVNLDVVPGPVVDVVADAHDIPFPDAFFDLVISQAVLEHLRQPQLMVDELTRVLKPGGLILVDVLFLWPVHMHSDFYRYTPMGLAELLRDCDAVKTGTNAGLAAATALINTQFWAALLCFGNRNLYRKLQLAVRPVTTLVKHFDRVFRRWDLPVGAPASTYFIGRKRDSVDTST